MEHEYLYMISRIPGIGAVKLRQLGEYFGSFQEVWRAGDTALKASGAMTPKMIASFRELKREEISLLREFEALDKHGIRYIAYFDNEYPKRCRPYHDRPAALFVKGRLPDDTVPSVSIVGARNCTQYGRQTAEYLASELAKSDVQIVSGLALGVDGAAHSGCLKAGGATFAVLGCGVNICYPRENYRLFERMEQEGGIISEFLPNAEPLAMHFPMRNRIISALSDAVLIVEAREKSGSLITADFALDQGKEVFAVPGRMNDPLSAGCNRLLRIGAAMCLGPKDVLDFLGIDAAKTLTENKNSEKALAKNEIMVYSFLDSRPKTLDEIVKNCQISIAEALEILMTLELYGFIQSDGCQYYCRKM